MMKKLLFSVALIAFTMQINAQTVIYEDDFESYTVGGYLAVQSDDWTTWSNAPGTTEDALIVNDQSNSPTKSVLVEGVSDLVLGFGNKISGEYELDMYYFIPTGFAGYYNFQRYESPGIEWVLEVYFNNNGTGTVHAGGQNAATFNYPQNQWVFIHNVIDLDDDWAELYINNNLIHAWQWSLSSQGVQGIVQLGGMNIFAGAPTGQTPKFYFDDVTFTEVASGTVPQVVVTPDEFMVDLSTGESTTDMINVANIGNAPLEYSIEINYAFPDKKNQVVAESTAYRNEFKTTGMDLVVDPNHNPGGNATSNTEDVVLNYDGPNDTGVGYPNPTVYEVAARFPHSMTLPYAGMELTQVDIYLSHVENCAFKIKIYGEGESYEPGPLLLEQAFAATFIGWYTITLSTPVTITGEDLWIGYWVAQAVGAIFPIGADAGPADPNGHFIKPGVGWTVSSLDYNWNIRGTLTGDGITQWLSVDPATGLLDPAEDADHTVTFDATLLTAGDYEGVLKVKSNDIANPVVTVPVTLDVILGVNDLGEPNSVMVYPNPTSDYLHIQANHQMIEARLFTNTGQLILSKQIDGKSSNLETSSLAPGIYLLQIETEAGISNRKVMIN
jgi:hypothetical protein